MPARVRMGSKCEIFRFFNSGYAHDRNISIFRRRAFKLTGNTLFEANYASVKQSRDSLHRSSASPEVCICVTAVFGDYNSSVNSSSILTNCVYWYRNLSDYQKRRPAGLIGIDLVEDLVTQGRIL